ncbi:type I-F CRISPR-associated endoribonuclease Cas6/Csy4 [Psychrobacter sp. KFRI-CH2-11]|uniref:type I-F CRISPR-associated endoribonuclease Cas6/Csy4 n=1 Tax=Psychrobacter sp. KFRI-CH2-11 TaxID=3156079 RepID=UPI003247754E
MNYYQEVTLIEGDKRLYEVWSDIYNQIHIALAEAKNKHAIDTIGVSFPNYRYEEKGDKVFAILGDKLRVFAPSQKDLETLNLAKWLERLTDYIHIKGIKDVGDKATAYVSVHRYRRKTADIQAKSLAEKLGVSYEDAMVTVNKRVPEKSVPYIQMRSQTNQSNYRLRILQKSCDEPNAGSFNTYGMNGMSDHVTVPHW